MKPLKSVYNWLFGHAAKEEIYTLNPNDSVREQLSHVSVQAILDGLVAEYEAWLSESFSPERIAEIDSGIDEIAERLEMPVNTARAYVADYIQKHGVHI